ncbi:MAG: isomerase [Gammaproteobacteria bacterium]|nr:isomerase [Gammaproteobacteria bacterium]MCP5201908.1 isomerase [Gammaproteobacteria bacterium]
MERYQRLMIANGLLVILVAMLAGFMLMFNLLGGLEVWPGTIITIPTYGNEAGWVRAHSGGTMNGLLVVVMALALPKLNLGSRLQAWTAWGFIYIAWSFTVFYWVGNASGNRALSIGDSPLGQGDWLSVIGFLPGLPSVFLVLFLLGVAARGVLGGNGRG